MRQAKRGEIDLPETDEQREHRLLKELEGKNVAHYSVFLTAWVQTRLEHDRALITLSAAAIGILVTILTTVGVNARWHILLHLLAFVAFGTTIFLCIRIYELNSDKLENEIRGPDDPTYRNVSLAKYDLWSLRSFITGVAFAAILGVFSALAQFEQSGGTEMSKKTDLQIGDTKLPLGKSLDGAEKLRPAAPITQPPAETQDGAGGVESTGDEPATKKPSSNNDA